MGFLEDLATGFSDPFGFSRQNKKYAPAIVGLGLGGPAGAAMGMQMIGAQETNAQNAEIAQNQMAFQERMSSTAHQRQVADLKAAGLNPILSANAGASTPAGAQATMQNPVEGLASTAMEIMMLKNNIAKQKGEIALLDSQKKKADMETKVMSKDVPKAELTNELYDALRPVVRKTKEAIQNTGKEIKQFKSNIDWFFDQPQKPIRQKGVGQ